LPPYAGGTQYMSESLARYRIDSSRAWSGRQQPPNSSRWTPSAPQFPRFHHHSDEHEHWDGDGEGRLFDEGEEEEEEEEEEDVSWGAGGDRGRTLLDGEREYAASAAEAATAATEAAADAAAEVEAGEAAEAGAAGEEVKAREGSALDDETDETGEEKRSAAGAAAAENTAAAKTLPRLDTAAAEEPAAATTTSPRVPPGGGGRRMSRASIHSQYSQMSSSGYSQRPTVPRSSTVGAVPVESQLTHSVRVVSAWFPKRLA
jgi:hypothetical protein